MARLHRSTADSPADAARERRAVPARAPAAHGSPAGGLGRTSRRRRIVRLWCLNTAVTEMTGVSDFFSGLDFEAVDWGGLTHAYGSAQDVPARIKSLVAPDADVRSAALGELFISICHQGTVCPASAPAIPFLARALVCAPGERAQIGLLMALMSRQYGEDWSDPSTLSGAVRAQVASVLGELVALLADPDPEVRRAVLRLVAVCPSHLVRALCDLREFDDADGRVRADALMALARVEHDWPGLRGRLEDGLLDGSPAVRQAASFTLLSLDGLPFPPDTAAVLADGLSAVGDQWAEPRDESWDRLPGTSLPDPHVDGAPAGLEALGVLTTLSLDRDCALEAAARIVAARTRHAQQGASLADEVFNRWRDTDRAVMAVIAEFLATATDVKYPSSHLRLLARCASRIEDPDPAIAAAVRPWADHDDHRVASAAICALAWLRDHRCLELAGRAMTQRALLGPDLVTVCEAYGERAAALLPRLRDQLSGPLAEPLRDGLNDPESYVIQALPPLGPAALAAVPDLLSLLEAGRSVRSVLNALTRLGAAARTASGGRDIAAAIKAAFTAAEPDHHRAAAAVALRAVAGDDSLARRLAADIAARPRWAKHIVPLLGQLGPAALACAPRVKDGLDSADPWTAVRAAHAHWNITGQARPSACVLARHVSARPVGQAAIEALLGMSRMPAECEQTLRHLADAPARLAHDGTPYGVPHADDAMRDRARALLCLQEQ